MNNMQLDNERTGGKQEIRDFINTQKPVDLPPSRPDLVAQAKQEWQNHLNNIDSPTIPDNDAPQVHNGTWRFISKYNIWGIVLSSSKQAKVGDLVNVVKKNGNIQQLQITDSVLDYGTRVYIPNSPIDVKETGWIKNDNKWFIIGKNLKDNSVIQIESRKTKTTTNVFIQDVINCGNYQLGIPYSLSTREGVERAMVYKNPAINSYIVEGAEKIAELTPKDSVYWENELRRMSVDEKICDYRLSQLHSLNGKHASEVAQDTVIAVREIFDYEAEPKIQRPIPLPNNSLNQTHATEHMLSVENNFPDSNIDL